MADGFNDVRAVRVTEIVQDFRALQQQISQIQVTPSSEDYYALGYLILRECVSRGHAVLTATFLASNATPNGDLEQEKQHLQYIMLDASARRLQAQHIYLRAAAAMRWVNSRNAICGGQRPTPAQQPQLEQLDAQLQSELARITEAAVYQQLLDSDRSTAKWVHEDPQFGAVQRWIARGFQ